VKSSKVARLAWQDVKNNLRPIRALPLLLLALLRAYSEVAGPMDHRVTHVQGALTLHNWWLFFTIPLLAGAMGGALAAERRAGITLSLLAKGVGRRDYVKSKLLGAASSSAIMTTISIFGFYAIVLILWPHDRVSYPGNDVSPGPLHQLYLENPLAHDMVCVPMFIAAAAALPLISVLAGLIVANEYVAIVATPIFVILSKVIVGQFTDLLNPEQYLNLGYYFYWGPHVRWLIPFAPFLYWGTFAFIITAICQRIFAKKEIA
jgi:ABC-type transport system involved in multi-copper enzyme maturation permease subunit